MLYMHCSSRWSWASVLTCEAKTVSLNNSALNACLHSPEDKGLIYSIGLFCPVEKGIGIVTRVCGCRTERKTALFFWTLGYLLSWEWNVGLQVQPNLGKENCCPFWSWIDTLILSSALLHTSPFFSSYHSLLLFSSFSFCLLHSLPPSFFLSFHSSQMSLQFNLLYCCNKVIHLFGQSLVNCRQINICSTIYFTSNDQWPSFRLDWAP